MHDYINLYICARNPMLFKRLDQRNDLCVLSVMPNVIDVDGVVVTDQNTASNYARYGAGADGLAIVNYELTFAEYWTHADPVEQFRRKAAKCAEAGAESRRLRMHNGGVCLWSRHEGKKSRRKLWY